MSDLRGHFTITDIALRELEEERLEMGVQLRHVHHEGTKFARVPGSHGHSNTWMFLSGYFNQDPAHDIAWGAVMRDVRDVVNLGHWREVGQKHHFMRKNENQTPRVAYDDAVNWIWRNVVASRTYLIKALQNQLLHEQLTRPAVAELSTVELSDALGNLLTGDVAEWLGYAVHATQDSFSPAHVRRVGVTENSPGEIVFVFAYSGAAKHEHTSMDELWFDPYGQDGLSTRGYWAKEATKYLLRLVFNAVLQGLQPGGRWEWDFPSFTRRFLCPSTDLAATWDEVDKFIEQYITRFASLAISIDEDQMALDLLRLHGVRTTFVLETIDRLDNRFHWDADDVVYAYVRTMYEDQFSISPKYAAQRQAIRSNPNLLDLMVGVLESGPTNPGITTAEEQEMIDYLEALKGKKTSK